MLETLEQSGVVEDEAVLVHGQVCGETALQALETIEGACFERGIALVRGIDGEIGYVM